MDWILSLWIVRFLRETIRRFNEDQGAVLAGYIAYSSMLASLPFLIFSISLLGVVLSPEDSAYAVDVLFKAVPEHVALTIEPVLGEVLLNERGGLFTLAILLTIYAASNGVAAIRVGLDRAYDLEQPRNFVVNRLIQLAFVFIGFLVFGLLAVLIIFAPLVFQLIEAWTDYKVPAAADIARYVIGGSLLYGLLYAMHFILPALPMHRKKLWPGILVSMLMWVVLASLFSLFLALAPTYTLTY
ncbi:MAG: YihY/virulence factor BrkB family protein, partial [Pseudomonadota bacterium]